MHFFHPIQQSAPHIYHSALPLSPTSSFLRPMILLEKALILDFYGCPDAWGSVIRTIKPNSGSFTRVTTFGHRIAAASTDGTVAIYDSVTGALRLSLSPGGHVQAIRGSSDGSMLFCAHNGTSITGWDIQTGGLIHTFAPQSRVEDIAICLKGRYLACGLWDGSVKIWEVGNKSEVATFDSGTEVDPWHLCWLEPGNQLVVARGGSAQVWDVIARRVLQSFTTDYHIIGVVYAQRLNRLVIVANSRDRSIITVVDPHTGTSFIHRISQQILSIAFSPATNEFVCGMGSFGVGLFSVLARSWRQLDLPSGKTPISVLPNGTVVAVIEGDSFQLLSLDEEDPPPRQPTTFAFGVYTLDEDNIIAILPPNREHDHIVLLELATMTKIRTIPPLTSENGVDYSKILCASLKHHIVVHYFGDDSFGYLELWRFSDETPSWTCRVGRRLDLVGGISPSGSRLVAINDGNDFSRVRVWDIENGTRVADIPVGRPWLTHPLKIRFESEDKFYSHHDTFRIPFTFCSSTIIRHKQLPPAKTPKRHYDVDDSHEWIVASSKRVCWIPPAYIKPMNRNYCLVGNVLIMAGQDGVVRKLTFQEPS